MNAGHCSAPILFVQLRIAAREGGHTQWADLLTSIKTIKVMSHKYAQRHISQVILDSVKSTTLTPHLRWFNYKVNKEIDKNRILTYPVKDL